MLLIDKYAYMNQLQSVHPVEKMTFTFALLLFSLIVREELISLITFFVMSAFIILVAKIPFRYYIKLLLLPGFFLLSSLVSIVISVTSIGTTLPSHYFSFEVGQWIIFIGHASVKTAVQLFFVVLGSMSCLYFLILTTSVQAICHILRKCHVPSLFIEIAELTYRFIFVFLESAHQIYIAQQSRLGFHSPSQWLRSISLLISALLVEVLQRTSELSNAMLARGYGDTNVYFENEHTYSSKNWLVIIVTFILIGTIYFWQGGIQ